ncbi:unnamed protein product [Periconia digitata]|uniref:Uncharacterized protein n=1 Tax=Periconia digitata TaxID=1303443 RepID=A0A9W4XW40_9PLEO|nr:unnamed protein product [Periconia digitata]
MSIRNPDMLSDEYCIPWNSPGYNINRLVVGCLSVSLSSPLSSLRTGLFLSTHRCYHNSYYSERCWNHTRLQQCRTDRYSRKDTYSIGKGANTAHQRPRFSFSTVELNTPCFATGFPKQISSQVGGRVLRHE